MTTDLHNRINEIERTQKGDMKNIYDSINDLKDRISEINSNMSALKVYIELNSSLQKKCQEHFNIHDTGIRELNDAKNKVSGSWKTILITAAIFSFMTSSSLTIVGVLLKVFKIV